MLTRACARLLADLEYEFDLDGDAGGQLGDADRGASVLAGLAEDIDKQLRGAVDDSGVFDEAGDAGHESANADRPRDSVQ